MDKDKLIEELVEALQWYIDNDETNEGDTSIADLGGYSWNEINAFWIEGKRRAEALIEKVKQNG